MLGIITQDCIFLGCVLKFQRLDKIALCEVVKTELDLLHQFTAYLEQLCIIHKEAEQHRRNMGLLVLISLEGSLNNKNVKINLQQKKNNKDVQSSKSISNSIFEMSLFLTSFWSSSTS